MPELVYCNYLNEGKLHGWGRWGPKTIKKFVENFDFLILHAKSWGHGVSLFKLGHMGPNKKGFRSKKLLRIAEGVGTVRSS